MFGSKDFFKEKNIDVCLSCYVQTKGQNGERDFRINWDGPIVFITQHPTLKETSSTARFSSNQQICIDFRLLSNVLGSTNHKLIIFK